MQMPRLNASATSKFLLLASLWCGVARADRPKVAVLAFTGPTAVKAQGEVVRALRGNYEIVPPAKWEAAAKRLFAKSRSTENIAAVASELGVAAVVTGQIKREGGWALIVTVRHGPSGRVADRLKYSLHGPRIDPTHLGQLADAIGPAVERSLSSAPNETPSAGAKATKESVDSGSVGSAGATPSESFSSETPAAGDERPSWAPFIDATAHFVLGGRHFAFDDPALSQFRSKIVPGVGVDITGFPLAFMAKGGSVGGRLVSGLGLGATFTWFIWPDAMPCQRDANGDCLTTTEHYGTTEYNLEAGLRWRMNLLGTDTSPTILFGAEYGRHAFSIDKKVDGTDAGPPDVTYSYLTFSLGLRWMFVHAFGLFLDGHIHYVLDAGAIQSASEFGPGGGIGGRVQLGFELRPWKVLVLRLSGYYEAFKLSFSTMTAAKTTMGDALDQYYGAKLGVGIVF